MPATLEYDADLVLTPPSAHPVTVLGPFSVRGSGSQVQVSTSHGVSKVFVVRSEEFGTDRVQVQKQLQPVAGRPDEFEAVVVGIGVKVRVGLGFSNPVTVEGSPELLLGVAAPANRPQVLSVRGGTVPLMAWWQDESGVSRVRVATLDPVTGDMSFLEGTNPHTKSGTPNLNARINVHMYEHATNPSLVEHSTAGVYIAWEEFQSQGNDPIYSISAGASRVRVKKYNGNDASPEWELVEGGGFQVNNADFTKNQHGPHLVEYEGSLYIGFHQTVDFNLAEPAFEGRVRHGVHVYKYNGLDASPEWNVVAGQAAAGCKCLNFDPAQDAREVRLVSYQTDAASPSSLYAAWLEFNGGVHQVRVAVYEAGTDDRWTFLDKGGLVGLNTDSSRAARHLHWVQTTPLNHAPDASGLDNFLHLLWEEDDEACGELPQIRVVVFNGNIRSPFWVPIHGELPTDVPDPAFGLLCSDKFDVTYECQLPSTLNRRPCKAATLPTGVATAAGDLVLSWSESGGDGDFDQLRAAIFGRIDNVASTFLPSTHQDPTWTAVEGEDENFFGMNRQGHAGYHARDPSLALVNGVVTAVWTELGVQRPHLRVAQWNSGVYPTNVDIRDPAMKVMLWLLSLVFCLLSFSFVFVFLSLSLSLSFYLCPCP